MLLTAYDLIRVNDAVKDFKRHKNREVPVESVSSPTYNARELEDLALRLHAIVEQNVQRQIQKGNSDADIAIQERLRYL